jgi:hypothetical protein
MSARRVALRAAVALAAAAVAGALVTRTTGCASRETQVWVEPGAKILVNGSEVATTADDGPTRFRLRLHERDVVRIEKPGRAPVTAELTALISPDYDAYWKAFYEPTWNHAVVNWYGGEVSCSTSALNPHLIYADPLARLRGAKGPFELPREGQGLILATNVRNLWASIDDGPRLTFDLAPDAAPEGQGAEPWWYAWSVPRVVPLAPGSHAVDFGIAGQVQVPPGEFVYICMKGVPVPSRRANIR